MNRELMATFPIHPKYPERICWGCDKYCAADDLRCGNGTIRTEHPAEVFGDDWFEWLMEKERTSVDDAQRLERLDSTGFSR